MTDDGRVLDLIEGAISARPYCSCGRHTTAVWRDGAVWLECSHIAESADGPWRRLLVDLTRPIHVHARLTDVAPRPAAGTAGFQTLTTRR
jgi:hypothetical protein